MASRNTDAYGGRFLSDPSGSSVLSGYQQATSKMDKDLIRRNIKPYKASGFEQSLTELRGMTDQQRYEMATKAVLAKNKVGAKKTTTNTGGGSKGGSSSGGTKRKTTTTNKPKQPTAKQQAKAAVEKAKRAAQAAAKAAAKRATQHKPPKGAAKPKPKKPTLPPKPAPKKPPVIRPSGSAPRAV